MGLLHRLKHMRKRVVSFPQFGNTLVTGNAGVPSATMSSANSFAADTSAYTQGPKPDSYLGASGYKDPFRYRSSYQHMQPEIAVKEPWAVSATYTNNVPPSTGTPKSTVAPGAFIGHTKAIAAPMTRQRELEWDAANPRTLQRFTFVTSSQRYFDDKSPLPEYTTPAVFTHAIQCNEYPMKQGWEQAEVPEPGMRQNEVGTSPPTFLSAPLKVTTIIKGGDGHRVSAPVKAPKRKKSGGS